MKQKKLLIFIALSLAVFAAAAFAKTESSIEADEMNYNVNTKAASAIGHVVYTHAGDIIKGDKAEGFIDKQVSVFGNPVDAVSEIYKTKLTAKQIVWTADETDKSNGFYEAFDTVRAKRDNGDFLNADYVRVNLEKNIYDATGNAEILYEQKYIKAAEVHRDGEVFSGRQVAKLEDRAKKYAIAAVTIDGKINDKDEITDAVADKDVVFDHTDKNGLKSRLYGDHAVYSKAKGTLTVTGNAHGLRSDGKRISADKLVYHEATEEINAVGRTKITFVTDK